MTKYLVRHQRYADAVYVDKVVEADTEAEADEMGRAGFSDVEYVWLGTEKLSFLPDLDIEDLKQQAYFENLDRENEAWESSCPAHVEAYREYVVMGEHVNAWANAAPFQW